MKALRLSLVGLVALGAVHCGDDGGSSRQFDRMGRSGVNTALTDPFFRESVAKEQSRHDRRIDKYNAAVNRRGWVQAFAPPIETSIAIFDGLDRNCGNQLLAGPTPTRGRYRALAEVLADDVLFVDTRFGRCVQYLAVEANALGVTNQDCGGRTPLEDTIDVTYSVLAAGALSGVDDGRPRDADGVASTTTFPFLAPPL